MTDPAIARILDLEPRRCAWCRDPLTTLRGRFCGRKCRQTAFRLRRRQVIEVNHGRPLRFAYADPPYPGTTRKRYASREVNHRRLLAKLRPFDGWALSTDSSRLDLPPQPGSLCHGCGPGDPPKSHRGSKSGISNPRSQITSAPPLFLAPLDPLIYSRPLTAALWDFDYTWEVYTPPAKRKRGYYALPILAGTELVGHVDPKADRPARRLRVMRRSVRRGHKISEALKSFAGWLGLK